MAQYDSYRSKNSWEKKQDRGGSETACLLLAKRDFILPPTPQPAQHTHARVWKSAAGPNWADWPPPHTHGQPIMTSSSSSKRLWSSSETMGEQEERPTARGTHRGRARVLDSPYARIRHYTAMISGYLVVVPILVSGM